MKKVKVRVETMAGVITSLEVGGKDFPFGKKDFWVSKDDGDMICLLNVTLRKKLADADLSDSQRIRVGRMLRKSDGILFGNRLPDNPQSGVDFEEVEF
jgi:hypothetical protein